jgi:hypothetical protein
MNNNMDWKELFEEIFKQRYSDRKWKILVGVQIEICTLLWNILSLLSSQIKPYHLL